MKQKLLNFTRLRSLVLLAVIAFLGAGQAWGEDLELSLNELYQNGTKVTAKTVITESGGSLTFTDENENFTLLLTRGSGNQPGFYTSSGYIRFYSEDTFKLTAAQGITITKIVVTPNGSSFSLNSLTGLDSSTKTWTGSASEVTFTGAGTNKWDKVTITYSSTGGTPTPTTYTVTYNANGGTGEMTDSNSPYDANATVTVLGNSFTRSGYTFTNWNTAANGSGTDYDEDDTFTITANTTLYAQWTENSGSGTTHTYNFAGANNFYTDANKTMNPSSGSGNNVETFYYSDGSTFVASGASRYFSAASSGYFLLGKTDATISLPTFNGYKITQVIIHSSSGHSTSVAVSIVSGNNTASAAQTWSTKDKDYTYNIGTDYQSSALSVKVTNNYNTQFTSITLVCEASNAVATPEISGTESFVTSTEVTITCGTDGATIQYSTDNGSNWTTYNGAFTLTETTTVKAKATKTGMTNSEEATKTFTKVTPLTNIAALTAETTAGSYYVTLTNAVVTYVNGNNAYIQDNSGAVLLYKNGHGLTAGDVLNGTATVTYQLHNGNPQITDLSGITPASGTAPDPTSVAQSSWNYTFNNVLSQYFQITGATITQSNSKYYVELNNESIQLYKSGESISSLDLTKTYTITGFPTLYTNNNNVTTKELTIFADPEVEVSSDPTIIASSVSLAGFTYEEGNGPSSVQTISVSGANLTANISLSLGNNSDFEMSTTEGSGYTNSLTLTQNNGTVSETTIYVRLKSGLDVGSYDGTITLASAGATDVEVSLSGSVTAPEAAHVTWDLTTASYNSDPTADLVTWSSNYATMTNAKGSSSTPANNYLGGSYDHTRFYKDNILTFTPVTGYSITEVKITAVSGYAGGFTGNTWTNASASTESTIVTVTPTDGASAFSVSISAACRATEVKVYYEADNTPSITLASTSLNANAAGDNGTIDITYANLTISDMSDFGVQFYDADDNELNDNNVPDWLEVLVAEQDPSIGTGYVVSYDIQANDGAARTAYFKVFAMGTTDFVYSDLVTVTQAAYVAPPTPGNWVAANLADINANDVFVIVGTDANSYTYALSNNNGTSSAPSAVEVTVSGSTLSGEINDNIKWNISGNATDGYTFYPNGDTENWLYCTNTNNGVRVGTNATNNTFTLDGESGYLKNVATSRYVGIYSAQDWRCYTNTTGNIANQTFAFYKQIEAVKLNDSYGYATFASTNPLNFTDYATAGYSAWAITGISGETITFSQITSIVPAGTGMLLMGETGTTVNISVANKVGTPVTNLLKGITAATDISTGEYYGLKGNEFVPVSAGTVPAGKALLPVSALGNNNGAKAFTFVFEGADGIKTVEHVTAKEAAEIFNLAGQRMSKMQRGVNIINGKKVLVK